MNSASETLCAQCAPRILVVIPVYNHAQTLRYVAEGVLAQHPNLLIVDDGSTDLPLPVNTELPPEHPLYGLPLLYLRHETNQGKGAAILSAAQKAQELGMSHIITIDADGQHYPSDIAPFVSAICRQPNALYVGVRDFSTENIPFSSRFGRSFSNFWFKLQTASVLSDTQCGFRAYPVCLFENIRFTQNRYSFEVEVLVRAAWAGFPVQDLAINVYYPPKGQRISHFKALADNVRISLLNTRLCIRAMMPWPHKQILVSSSGQVSVLSPLRSLRLLLEKKESPKGLALAAALGMFLGTLALPALHSILIILIAGHLRLNKVLALAVSQVCMPPFVPALCIEAGHYLRHGVLLTDISWQTLGYEALQRLYEWVLGSLVAAPVFALLAGFIVYGVAVVLQKSLTHTRGTHTASDAYENRPATLEPTLQKEEN